MVATTMLYSSSLAPEQCAILWLAGLFSSVLPDIDSDPSATIRYLFTSFGIAGAFFTVVVFYQQLPLAYLWLSMCLVFVSIRFVLMRLFARYTVHRGIYHSLLAAVFFSMLSTLIAVKIVRASEIFAWAVGAMVLSGYVIHLILDEIFAVDFSGVALKRSFGTAIKPVSLRNGFGSVVLAAGCLVISRFLSVPKPIVDAVRHIRIDDFIVIFVQ